MLLCRFSRDANCGVGEAFSELIFLSESKSSGEAAYCSGEGVCGCCDTAASGFGEVVSVACVSVDVVGLLAVCDPFREDTILDVLA